MSENKGELKDLIIKGQSHFYLKLEIECLKLKVPFCNVIYFYRYELHWKSILRQQICLPQNLNLKSRKPQTGIILKSKTQ
jgi:hypothetical protein